MANRTALPTPKTARASLAIAFAGDARRRAHPIHNISACVSDKDTLFLAADEEPVIERFRQRPRGGWSEHERFPLKDFLDLADPDEEVDIEGLAVDDGWLWLTGSHSRTRPDPRRDGRSPDRIDVRMLADLQDTRSRCVLARIPLVESDGLLTPIRADGTRRAGLVPQVTRHGSRLAAALAKDPLIAPSMRMAAKEGGLDIEGLAVAGPERVALGLRGPVIQTFALLLEVALTPRANGALALAAPPVQRLLDLAGLGVRDLVRDGDDLLILAGPTGDVDGRCAVYRWENWVNTPADDAKTVKLHRPERLFDLPIRLDCDHPEGIELVRQAGRRRLLVLYDSPAPARIDLAGATMRADLFAI